MVTGTTQSRRIVPNLSVLVQLFPSERRVRPRNFVQFFRPKEEEEEFVRKSLSEKSLFEETKKKQGICTKGIRPNSAMKNSLGQHSTEREFVRRARARPRRVYSKKRKGFFFSQFPKFQILISKFQIPNSTPNSTPTN